MQPVPGGVEQPNRPRTGNIIVYGISLFIFGVVAKFAPQSGYHIKIPGSNGPNGVGDLNGKPKPHVFDHDFFMASMICLTKAFCLIIYWILNATSYGSRLFPKEVHIPLPGRPRNIRAEQNMQYNKALFIPPAIFNYAATCLLYVGFNLTYPSSIILFKGTLLFFTSLLSVAFLGRNMNPRMWTGVVIGILGLAVLGINDYVFHVNQTNYDTNGIVAGDLLIVMAQIMYATQAVYEQKILTRYTNMSPLEAVGYEGLWGLGISFILLIPFSFVNAGAFSKIPGHFLEDPFDAFKQMRNSWKISLLVTGTMLFSTLHYWVALMITKDFGATPRMVINSLAYAMVWGILLILKWQAFDKYIIPGFVLVGIGFMVYFDHIFWPFFQFIRRKLCHNAENMNGDGQALIPNGNAGIQEE